MTPRPRIVFADDDPSILAGLRRMLRTHRDRWDMTFAEGGQAALDVVRAGACDVVVSDYRMPGMDGAQLLERVRAESPGTARVILSGQTNEENLLAIMVLAHEVLTKPAAPEQLIATIERLIGVHATISAAGAAMAESLPSPPGTLIDLVAALNEDDPSPRSVGAVIERDPAASAKILRLVNSSAYSIGRQVSDVTQAITLLGLPTVRGLVLMHDLVVAFRADMGLSSAWIDGLTLHSVETSRLSGLLAAGTDWQSQAITAGLLHEVGQLVQASSEPVGFSQVIAAWHDASGTAAAGNDAAGNDAEDVSLRAFEVPAFGVSHVEAGANLLSLWGLPTPVVHAVASHAGRPASAPADDLCSTVAIAHRAVEAEIGLVCGPVAGEVEAEWDERTREVVNRWRRERSGRAR